MDGNKECIKNRRQERKPKIPTIMQIHKSKISSQKQKQRKNKWKIKRINFYKFNR